MAHQKKPSRPRRVQILDVDGWIHITSTNPTAKRARPSKPADQLAPAEIPDGLTFDKLKEKYDWHKQRWIESDAWAALKKELVLRVTGRLPGKIQNCVCVGLGSPSGLLRGGWVDRRSISLFQLAALESILDLLVRAKVIDTEKLYAQDPVFNDMDSLLLESIGFKVVQDPEAFSLVQEQTFLYAPGAERHHLVKLLAQNPVMVFSSSLDSTHSAKSEEDLFGQFLQRNRSLALPEFESNPTAFWRTTLYSCSKECATPAAGKLDEKSMTTVTVIPL